MPGKRKTARLERFNGGAGWALAAVLASVLPLWHLLFTDRFALLYRDLGTLVLLKKQVWRDSVLRFGELPLWNHWTLGGTPYLADPAGSAYYPLNLVFLLFPANQMPLALAWYIYTQLALVFLFAWLLARALAPARADNGLRETIPALAFAGGAYVFSYIYLPDYLGSIWGSLAFLYCCARFRPRRDPRWLFAASLALSMPAFAGDPQTSFVMGVFFAPILLWESKNWRRGLLALAALGGLSVLAYGAQLIPALKQLAGSTRDFRLGPIPEFEQWSMHPMRFLEWISALPFGTEIYRDSAIAPYLNGPDPAPFIASIYPGVLFLPLLLAALPELRTRRELRAWFALGFLFVVLSLGHFSPLPLNRWLAEVVPLWGSFRYPERLLLYAEIAFAVGLTLALALEAGADRVFSRLRYLLPMQAALAALLALLAWPAASGRFGAWNSAGFAALATALIWGWHRFKFTRSWWTGGLLVVAALDFVSANSRIVYSVPSLVAQPHFSPFARLLAQTPEALDPSSLPARFFNSSESSLHWDVLDRHGAGLGSQGKLSLHPFFVLHLNTAAYFGYPVSLGFATVADPRHLALWNRLQARQFLRVLGLRGTKYLGGGGANGAYRLGTLREYTPYFFWPRETWFSPNDEVTLRLLEAENWPWTERLIVQPVGELASFPSLKQWQPGPRVAIGRHSYREIVAKITTGGAGTEPGWLLWNETFTPNWTARLDGEEIPVHLGNYWATALRLPALDRDRTYRLEIRLDDPLIPLGQAISAIWLLLFLWVCWRMRRGSA